MESIVPSPIVTKLTEYGAMGLLVSALSIAVYFLYRQNLRLYADNVAAHEKRVEDAKKMAAEHAAAVAKLEVTVDSLHEFFNVAKEMARRR